MYDVNFLKLKNSNIKAKLEVPDFLAFVELTDSGAGGSDVYISVDITGIKLDEIFDQNISSC